MGRVLQTALSVASDFLKLIGSDAITTKFANDVEQELNAVYKEISIVTNERKVSGTYTLF